MAIKPVKKNIRQQVIGGMIQSHIGYRRQQKKEKLKERETQAVKPFLVGNQRGLSPKERGGKKKRGIPFMEGHNSLVKGGEGRKN